jgi:general secretion pathway protein J
MTFCAEKLHGSARGDVRDGGDDVTCCWSRPSPLSPWLRSRGFTLIELLAAITLLGLLAAILMGTVRGAERSTTAATDASERTEQYTRTQTFLRDHVGGALPLRWRREVNQPLKFDGQTSTLTYLAPVTSQIAEGGVLWWQLGVAKASNPLKGGQLVLRRQPIEPDEKAVPDLSKADVIVLADNIERVSLSYFDPGDDPITNPEGGVWVDAWDENARMPLLISVKVVEAGDRRWPELIVPMKLSQAMGCNFDFQRQRCVIQSTVVR